MIAVWLSAPPSTVAKPAIVAGSISAVSAGVSSSATTIVPSRQMREGREGRLGQVADQPGADLADIVGARREIGVVDRREFLGDRGDLRLDRGFGIDAVARRCGSRRRARTREPESICRCASSRMPISSAAGAGSPRGLGFSLRICFRAEATASAKRACSASTWSASIVVLGHLDGAGLDEMGRADGDAGRDAEARRRPARLPAPARLLGASVFIELASDQIERRRPARPRPAARPRVSSIIVADAGGEHHQPHDRAAGDGQIAACRTSISASNWLGELDEFRRGAGVQAALVADGRRRG